MTKREEATTHDAPALCNLSMFSNTFPKSTQGNVTLDIFFKKVGRAYMYLLYLNPANSHIVKFQKWERLLTKFKKKLNCLAQ